MSGYFLDDNDDVRVGRAVALGLLVIVLVVGLVVGGKFAGWWFSNATANTRGNVDKTNQINGNGSYRIAAYDHFFDACAAVQNDEAAIRITQDELATHPDAARVLQLQTNLSAQKLQRATDINQYNVDARKAGTLGQFRSSNLPYQIDASEASTSCTS